MSNDRLHKLVEECVKQLLAWYQRAEGLTGKTSPRQRRAEVLRVYQAADIAPPAHFTEEHGPTVEIDQATYKSALYAAVENVARKLGR